MIENPILKSKGAKWWHSHDLYSPALSKNSLSDFFYTVLSEEVQIGEIWVFNRHHKRSPVYVTIFMTEEIKNKIEEKTKFKFIPPPKVHLN